jgi:hypothetical protein
MGQGRVMTRLEMFVLSDDGPWHTFGNINQQQQPGQPVRAVHRLTNHGPPSTSVLQLIWAGCRVGPVLYGLRPLWSGLTGLGNHRHSFRMVARLGASFLHLQGFVAYAERIQRNCAKAWYCRRSGLFLSRF